MDLGSRGVLRCRPCIYARNPRVRGLPRSGLIDERNHLLERYVDCPESISNRKIQWSDAASHQFLGLCGDKPWASGVMATDLVHTPLDP